MAIGDPYVSVPELRSYCGPIPDDLNDVDLAIVAAAISNGIEEHTGRQYNDAGEVSARVFSPKASSVVAVDDFHTTDGLIVKTGDDGTFGTTLTDFRLEPLNGVQHGRPGFPFRKIRLRTGTFLSEVEVTARWGWAEVPPSIKQAALMQGARKFRRRYSPSGFQTVGSGDMQFTSFVSRIEDPDVVDLLRDFVLPSFQFC